eukprot:CAMPEP_0114585698 /NCGR_PEP_ID=MMETSP0125-20121206/9159_1 /TAXON_ID=485358 ORGANISM="Aristerostoma sp., Strain ATCC 50986" /NCGR_SAMPLE_ID=MMETSP0125 /ASSEMBLY_ACC=CAM_ASM_000245 /LENGTH=206 /DNA_ID=CAMNT_0001780871 /DNA_START=319 /DNA_END=939 /DNA_ORIENTATION=-
MPKDGPTDFKYKTKAGQYYRDMLKAKSEGKDIPEAPTPEEGLELLVIEKNKADFSGMGSTPEEKNDIGSKVVGFFGKAVDVTVNTTKNVAKGVKDKVNDPNFKQSASEFGSKVTTGTKNFVGKVGDTFTKDNVKEFGGKVGTGVKNTASYLGNKSKEIWDDRDEIAKKTSSALKSGWSSALGFFGVGGKKEEKNLEERIQEVEYEQ